MPLEVNGQSYETDEEGYLANLNDWQPDLAEAMAAADGAELSDNHWEVINFLREYYEEYQIAPAVRVLTKAIGKKLGKDKGNSKYLYELFPYGPAKQACKYAGLPKTNWLRLELKCLICYVTLFKNIFNCSCIDSYTAHPKYFLPRYKSNQTFFENDEKW